MLYLVTGSNGAGKTLFTLKWVRERQLKENRPVCHNGRFEPVEGGELSSWKKIDFKDWQNEPDGTIFVIDECHNDIPVSTGKEVPDHIRMLAEHRRRGFDFYLVTQHPSNIHSFVRRLVGAPGWHRHLKRVFGAGLVSILEWNFANNQCETYGSGKTGDVNTAKFPSEVFTWYKSASLHTAKKSLPKKVYFGLAALVGAAYFGWSGYQGIVAGGAVPGPAKAASVAVPAGAPGGVQPARYDQQPVRKVMTSAEYAEAALPRFDGLPYTAPKYDEITRPTRAPVPAACVSMKSKGCRCYTQAGTLIPGVSSDMCRQIIETGFFLDFDPDGPEKGAERPQERQAGSIQPERQSPEFSPSKADRRASLSDVNEAFRVPGGRVEPKPW